MRISVIRATKDVPMGVELTVDYSSGYSKYKTCLCRAEDYLEKETKEKAEKKAHDARDKKVRPKDQKDEFSSL
jgi:hypothetical protein